MNLFERYLTVWVGLCMVAGVLLGRSAPGLIERCSSTGS
jgi:ACR3 family arsenite transporter